MSHTLASNATGLFLENRIAGRRASRSEPMQQNRKRTPNPMVFVLQLGVVGVWDDIHSE